MNNEPAWVDEIRQQMKTTPFYEEVEKEREQYEKEYYKVLKTLNLSQAKVIEQYVELLKKCEFHHVRIAYLEGLKNEDPTKLI